MVAALVGVSRLDVGGERLTCLTFTDLTAEHTLLDEVRASQQRFEALYKGAPVPAYTWQNGARGLVLIDYNDAAGAATQLSGSKSNPAGGQMLGSTAAAYYRHDPQLLADLTRCLVAQDVVQRDTVRHATAIDPEQHLHVTMVPVPPDLVVVHKQDVTESWTAERSLRTSEERYRTIVENAQEGISILDPDGHFTFANQRTADLLGHDVSTLVGKKASLLLGAIVTSAPATPGVPGTSQYEVTALRPDGSEINLLVSTAPILLAGSERAGSLCMMSDVSGLRQAEEELAHWALHDSLTGLPNRNLLVDRIGQTLTRASRQPGTVAALFCDVDDFKEVNDSFGHHVGDEVLKAVAARLRAAVRPSDTVARIGGDEFVVLCEGMDDESVAFGIASRVLTSVSLPLEVSGHELTLSVSVGVAFAVSPDAAELLRNADAAMYLAKKRGRNRAELFDEQLRQVAAERIGLIADLRHAVARSELRVHYQPVFTLDGEQLLGVEALVRWQHPQRGLLFPDAFIPAAETASLIGEIGAWVLHAACRQAALWAKAGPGGSPLHMAVNVSARQLAQGSGLVQLVAEELRSAGIDPATLILEVTESAVMDDAEQTLAILTDLKALGVRLAIDDFGTGYSSLIYLKRFPVDQLKVDRAFVSGLGTDPDDSAIVASVVSLARAVGIVVHRRGCRDRSAIGRAPVPRMRLRTGLPVEPPEACRRTRPADAIRRVLDAETEDRPFIEHAGRSGPEVGGRRQTPAEGELFPAAFCTVIDRPEPVRIVREEANPWSWTHSTSTRSTRCRCRWLTSPPPTVTPTTAAFIRRCNTPARPRCSPGSGCIPTSGSSTLSPRSAAATGSGRCRPPASGPPTSSSSR